MPQDDQSLLAINAGLRKAAWQLSSAGILNYHLLKQVGYPRCQCIGEPGNIIVSKREYLKIHSGFNSSQLRDYIASNTCSATARTSFLRPCPGMRIVRIVVTKHPPVIALKNHAVDIRQVVPNN